MRGQNDLRDVEQIGAVDGERLGALAGHLRPAEMWDIDEALITVLAPVGP